MSSLHARLAPTMRAQHGLVTVRQVLAAGGSRTALTRLVRRGHLERVEHGVYAAVGAPCTWERRLLATLLAAGDGAAASHRACARLLGLPRFAGAPLEISVPSPRSFRGRPDVLVHESGDLRPRWVLDVDGIPCTTPLRLAVDLGAVVGRSRYTDAVMHLRRSYDIGWHELVSTYLRHRTCGRDGTGALGRLLRRYGAIDGVTESALERVALDLLLDAGVPAPVLQHPVLRYRVDMAYPELRIAVEIDGPHHLEPWQAERDRRRDAALRAAGWRVVRITKAMIVADPGCVARLVSAALLEPA